MYILSSSSTKTSLPVLTSGVGVVLTIVFLSDGVVDPSRLLVHPCPISGRVHLDQSSDSDYLTDSSGGT